MPRITLPFAGPTREDRSINVSPQRSINLFPAIKLPGSKGPVILYSEPGKKPVTVAGTGPISSNFVLWKGNLYFASGKEIYKFDGTTATLLGAKTDSTARTRLAAGRDYIAFVDGSEGWTYDATNFTKISDGDFPAGATHIVYLDGFFLVNKGSSDQFHKSASEDPTSWNALEFEVSDASPDDTLAIEVGPTGLIVVGSEVMQQYFNSGNVDFPFSEVPGTTQVGIDAPNSIARGTGAIYWLATNEFGDSAVIRMAGGRVTIISDTELNWQINQFSKTSDAIGWVRRQAGFEFYDLTFPSADRSYTFSVDFQQWHERKSWNIGRDRANGYGYLNGKHYVGDFQDGRIYELDFDTYDEAGDPFERTRRTQITHDRNLNITVNEITMEIEAGVGTVSGQGLDPQMMMRYGINGHNWSSELHASMGKTGEFTTMPVWHSLGQQRAWNWEFKVTDPVKVVMTNLYADVDVATS